MLVGSHDDVGAGGEWRIAQIFSKFHFFAEEAFVILVGCETNGIVVGIQCLDNNVAGSCAPAGATGGLGEKLKGTLGGAVIGNAESDVGQHNANQGYVWDVMTFGNHLGADQDVDFTGTKRIKNILESALRAGAIAVEPGDARRGQVLVKLILNTF